MKPKPLPFGAVSGIKSLFSAANNKTVFLVFSAFCLTAIVTCVIVNYAIDRQITWAAYAVLSVQFGWLCCIPLIYKKFTLSLCVLTVASFPFLYFIEKITPVTDWFFALGLPAAVTGAVSIWITYLLFRYVKISVWYKFSISVFLIGVVADRIISHYVDAFLETEPSFIKTIGSILLCVVISALLWVQGYTKNKMKNGRP